MAEQRSAAGRPIHPLREFFREVFSDHTQTAAAALAFHAMFGLLPALAAAAAIWALVGDPTVLRAPVEEGAERLLADQDAVSLMVEFVTEIPAGLGFGAGLLLNIAIALWAMQRAASGLLTALNIVYDESERRSFVRREAVAIGLALATVLLLMVSLALIALPPLLAGRVQGGTLELVGTLRWPALVLLFALAVGALYTFAPSRPRWRNELLSWGTLAATLIWVAASAGLSLYVSWAAGFGVFYGSVGGGVVVMLWFYLTALAVLAGAEVNAVRWERRQGREDATKGMLRAREGLVQTPDPSGH